MAIPTCGRCGEPIGPRREDFERHYHGNAEVVVHVQERPQRRAYLGTVEPIQPLPCFGGPR